MEKKFIVFIVFIFVLSYGYGEKKKIVIAAATNLNTVLSEIKKDFEDSNKDITVEIIFGASGKLATQIKEGAPFDIFMSADTIFPEMLYKDFFCESAPKVYASGKLVIFTALNLDLKRGIDILKDNNIKLISIANPETAPYGTATVEALRKYGIFEDIKDKIVRSETLSQVIHQVITSSDVGITAMSLMFSKDMQKYEKNINWSEINPDLYKKMDQAIIILKQSKNKESSKLLYNYIFSDYAKEIFKKYGYDVN